jgi:hypothetical protein
LNEYLLLWSGWGKSRWRTQLLVGLQVPWRSFAART